MAQADLTTFIQTRLRALVPGIDVSSGSPAETEFITPLVAYLGTDPFETDIDKFLTDRFRQEFPDIFAGDPSAIRDLFAKPLRTFLEPLKREIQSIKRGQSYKDPRLLSDEDADALAANVFVQRATGDYSSGMVRVYYANPSNVPFELTVRFATADGLDFFPTAPTSITAEEMVFNRDGPLYYADVPVKASAPGTQYNIGPGAIVSVTGLYGVAKVTNPQSFTNGADTISTPDFVAQTGESLNERSLLNRRGAVARLRDAFPGQLRAIQVIGAQDVEMQRDILHGSSKGHTWITGRVVLYGHLALVQARTVDDSSESSPVPGDTLYVYLDPVSYPALQQIDRTVRLTIEEVIGGKVGGSGAFQCSFLLRWSGSLPVGITAPLTGEGGCARKGTLTISGLPSIGAVDLNVPDREVHLFGHTDIYVRPKAETAGQAVISNLVDSAPLVERTSLVSWGPAYPNGVADPVALTRDVSGNVSSITGFDFGIAGVEPGDLLSIESGDAAGIYTIGDVVVVGGITRLMLTTPITHSFDAARYRISKHITIDPFDPKIPKLPFSGEPSTDLQTSIGSLLVEVGANTINYGVRVGDTLRILNGPDAGDFSITGFDAVLSGRGLLLDRPTGATESGLSYMIFTTLEPVAKPLVRIKEIMLLDSAKKATGISVPPALPVAVMPVGNFSSAASKGRSYQQSGCVLPNLSMLTNSNTPATEATGDSRYSTGNEPTNNGRYKAFFINSSNTRDSELLVPAEALSSCCWFLAMTEDLVGGVGSPPVTFEVGGVLQLLSGPNKGGYLIRDVHKFRYFNADGNSMWINLVQIHGQFPVDMYRQLLDFLAANSLTFPGYAAMNAVIDAKTNLETWATGIRSSMAGWLNSAIGALGGTPPSAPSTQAAIDSLLYVDYEVGSPARGVLRTYFQQPTLFEQNTGSSATPTLFDFMAESGEKIPFRPDPDFYTEHSLLPARGVDDALIGSYPNDIRTNSFPLINLSVSGKPTAFALGIEPGDVLEVYPQVLLPSAAYPTTLLSVADSPVVTCPVGSPFLSLWAGYYLYIDEGQDAGLYRIIDVPNGHTLVLDRPLTVSTPQPLATGVLVSALFDGINNVVNASGIDFTGMVGSWITLAGVQADPNGHYWAGSYRIASVSSPTSVTVDRTIPFPGNPGIGVGSNPMVIVTAAPVSAPTTRSGTTSGASGTASYGARNAWIYADVPIRAQITAVLRSTTQSQFTVDPTIALVDMLYAPYRVYRPNRRRVNPMEMQANKEGALFYFDTQAVSLSPHAAANIQSNSYLVPREGSFSSVGYRHMVDDKTLTYSMKESGKLLLPLRLLPPFATDRLDNEVSLIGAPVQVTYDLADVVANVQSFIQSSEDRTTAANMLARHFLPAYVSYDASYSGGSAADVIAADIISHIEGLPIETAIDVSKVQDLITKRGGNIDTPSDVVVLLHDWSRRIWMEKSTDQVGGLLTKVPYEGTPRVSYFVPGPNGSASTYAASGERIKLTKR